MRKHDSCLLFLLDLSFVQYIENLILSEIIGKVWYYNLQRQRKERNNS